MFLDGLEDAYDKGRLMGSFAEDCAGNYQFTREAQDAFALASLSRALAANNDGSFGWEIAPVTVTGRKGDVVIDKDEQPGKANPDKIPTLKPAFRKDGTVTAANSSSISDGAAALVLMRRSTRGKARPQAARRDRRARDARAGAGAGSRPRRWARSRSFTGNRLDDARRRPVRDQRGVCGGDDGGDEGARLPHDKVNVHGGACALGHPIGASGARIIVTLHRRAAQARQKRGVASLCIGGGEATAMAI